MVSHFRIETTEEVDDRIPRNIESSRELEMNNAQQQNDIALSRLGFNNILGSILFPNRSMTQTATVTIPTSYSFITIASTKTVRSL